MVKITNEIDGKKYELVPNSKGCEGCAFCKKAKLSINKVVVYNDSCKFDDGKEPNWNDFLVCVDLDGVWKEVKYENRD